MSENKERLFWIDNLRVAIVMLVVNFHSCITYSHVGDWYLKEGPEGSLVDKLPYIFWIFHLQSFFMGVLFFVAGAMAERAICRHGTRHFLVERIVRLGIPAFLYMLVIHTFIIFELLDGKNKWYPGQSATTIYLHYLTSGDIWSGSGPLWFALALLLFCIVYSALRFIPYSLFPATSSMEPSLHAIFLFTVALSLLTFFVRVYFPLGTSILNFQIGYFPQYILFLG